MNSYGFKSQTLTLIQGEDGLRQEPACHLGGRGPLQPHLGLRLRGPLRRRAEAAPQDPRVTAQPPTDGGAPQGRYTVHQKYGSGGIFLSYLILQNALCHFLKIFYKKQLLHKIVNKKLRELTLPAKWSQDAEFTQPMREKRAQ